MKKITLEELNIEASPIKEYFSLELFDLIDGSKISLPIALINKGQGPTALIVAAQHGNEWNGAYVADALFSRLTLESLKGKVIILPIANPPAFLQKSRVSSFDFIDMNRTFGFVKKRKPTEHLAKIIFEEFAVKSDYLVDLHSGGPGEYLPVVEVIDQERLDLALSLNLGRAIVIKKDTGSIVPNCEKAGVKAFSIEAGRALKINYNYAELLTNGLLNFLKKVGILEGQVQTNPKQNVFTGKIVVPSTISGFFKTNLELGQKVIKGQEIARIKPLFKAKSTTVKAPADGVVIYLRYEELISEGESIAHIAST